MCEDKKNENEGASQCKSKFKEKQEKIKKKIEELKDDILDCVLSVIPADTVKHLGNSKKEVLLALKSLIDSEIEKIDKRMKDIDKKKQ